MDRLTRLALCTWLALAAPAYAAGAPERGCDPSRELEAAKAAMARGDREGAVEHLLRADEILAACEHDSAPAGSGTEPDSAERLLASRL